MASQMEIEAKAELADGGAVVVRDICQDQMLHTARWYAVQSRPRHEKRIAEELALRSIDHFLPVHHCRHRWKNGVIADVELPLFPCYLFAKVALCDKVRLLQLPGVIGFAVNSSRPTALPEDDIRMLKELTTLCEAQPHPFLNVGSRVRVIAGPLAGMEGILVRRKQELRVVLSLEIIMRSVSVEVSEFDIEPISSGRKQKPD